MRLDNKHGIHVNEHQETIMNLRNKVHGLREILHFENWPELILKRAFFTANPLAVYRVGGMTFWSITVPETKTACARQWFRPCIEISSPVFLSIRQSM